MTEPIPGRVSSPLTTLREWEDEDANDGGWPYPTRYTESEANGELAERIRRALGVADDLPVYVTEEVVSGGWSEYTQEDDYTLAIRVGTAKHEIEDAWSGGLVALLRWLDQAAPVEEKP